MTTVSEPRNGSMGIQTRRAPMHSVPDRLPPNSQESEQGVLGCVLLGGIETMIEAQGQIESGDAFYDLRHRTIWDAVSKLTEESRPVDMISVQAWLRDAGNLEQVGGLAYLAALPDCVPSAGNVGYYAGIVVEKWLLRRMIRACTDAVSRIYESEHDAEALIEQAERDILSVRSVRAIGTQSKLVKPLVLEAVEAIEALHARQGAISGIATGFVDLDRMIDGLHPQELTIIAGFPSHGKTSLVMNIVEHVAIEQRLPIGVFSLEMDARALVLRMICSRSRTNMRDLRDGLMSESAFGKLSASAAKIAGTNIVFVDQSDMTLQEVRAKARRMKQEFGIRLIILDYVQLLSAPGRMVENKTQEIAQVAFGLKNMAKELEVPVLVASQLTKEKDGTVKCRGAAELHQAADNLFFIVPDKEHDTGENCRTINLQIAKQRNGPTGSVKLTFLKDYTRFESASKVSQDQGELQSRKPYRD